MAKSKEVPIKYPAGWRGISLLDTREDTQEELFFPEGGLLVAVNAAGDFEMGTLVVDLDDKSQIDGDRAARLQSAFRVIKYPDGNEHCAIGIQLNDSGKKDTHGYFVDKLPQNKDGSTNGGLTSAPSSEPADGGGIAIGQGSHLEDGPFWCGNGKCPHKKGEDDEGNPMSPIHWYYKTLWYKSDALDGPMKFEDAIPDPGKDSDIRISCHLSFDPGSKKWYWWSTIPLRLETVEHHPMPPETVWHHINLPIDPTKFNPTMVPTVGNTNVTTPGQTNPPPAGPKDVPTYDPVKQRPDGSKIGLDELIPFTQLSVNSATADGLRQLVAASALSAPAFAFRPQNYNDGQTDTGTFTNPTAQALKKQDNSPVSGIASAFAAQGGTVPASGSYGPSASGGQGDPWIYNQQPAGSKVAGSKNSKYKSGTANGGLVFHPPETDLRDAKNLAMQPSNVTLSTTYILVAPGAYFGAGVPELVTGRLKDGYSWGMDTTTGDMLFRSHSDSQTPFEAVRFTKTSQNIRWMSQQSFYGEIDHANTANRTYTFPDASGTVALTSDLGNKVSSSVMTSQVDIASSTSPADVTGLTIAVGANETWLLQCDLDIGTALSTTGIKLAVTVPTGSTVVYQAELLGVVPGTAKTYGQRATSSGTALDFTAANLASQTDGRVSIMIYVATSSTTGNVQIQASQSTSSLTNLSLRVGSRLIGVKQ